MGDEVEATLLRLADCAEQVVHLRKALEACGRLGMANEARDAVATALARAELQKLQLEDHLRELVEHHP